MRQRCAVCAGTNKDAVDSWLQAGKSQLGAAKAFGYPRATIVRHLKNGHVPQTATAPPPTQMDGDIEPVAALQDRLNKLSNTPTDGWTPAQLDRINEQIRRTAESLSRMRPPVDKEGPAQRSLVALQEMVAVQMEVIERHPEIRAEIAEALKTWKSTR